MSQPLRVSLGRDARGVILVPAIVMGSLLVGALFYVAAAGDAMIFRTQLQDAADSSAFTAAVWHARGMNLIAAANIAMSLMLFIVVVFHLFEMILLLLAIIPGIGAFSLAAARTLMTVETRMAKGIDTGLNLFVATEETISLAVPLIAAVESRNIKTSAESTLAGGLSLVPVPLDNAVNRVLKLEETRMPGVGTALPLQADSFGALCAKAAKPMAEAVAWLVDKVAGVVPIGGGIIRDAVMGEWRAVESTFDAMAEAGDGVLCQSVDAMIAHFAADTLSNACESEATDDQTAADQAEAEANGEPPPEPTEAEADERERRRREQANECAGGLASDLKKNTGFSARPAMVWQAAANGHAFMHTWSRATAQPPLWGRDQAALAITDGGSGPAVTPSTVAYAEAEFYYNCTDKWSNCMGDATWQPNWTARMRRFRNPGDELKLVASGPLLDLGGLLQEAGTNFIEEIVPRMAGRGNKKREAAGEAVVSLALNYADKIPGFEEFFARVSDLMSGGLDAAGLSDLLDARDPDERRIH